MSKDSMYDTPVRATTTSEDEIANIEYQVREGNKDLASQTTEELQYEAMNLQQKLIRRQAEAKVVSLRARLVNAQRMIDQASRLLR